MHKWALIFPLLLSASCVQAYQERPDSGVVPDADAGMTATSTVPVGTRQERIACNPVQNAGCDATAGEACIYDAAKDTAQCGRLSTRLAHEEPCSALHNSCDRNLSCTALPKDHESRCYRVCDSDTGTGCENLPGTSPNYICMGLADRSYGVCVGTGVHCDPNEDPCADTEVCSLLAGETVCVPAGAAAIGESCSTEECTKGALCANLADLDGPRCFLPCDTQDGICPNPDEVCTGVEDQRFGICQKTQAACSPLAQSEQRCPAGQVCSLNRTDASCTAAGTAEVGAVCEMGAACAAPGSGDNGAVCARLFGEASARCYESCDLAFPTCTNPGTGCSDIGLTFGICI